MPVSPLAGKPADASILVDVPKLVTAYYTGQPDPAVAAQRVAFGTSGHRGSSLDDAFNEAHILAITQAICLYRKEQGIDGPALHRHRHARAVGAGVRERARGARGERRRGTMSTPPAATRRRPSSPTRSSRTTAAAATGSPTASSSRRRTTRRGTAASSTTRRNGGPADTDVTEVDREAGQRLHRRRPARRGGACPSRRARAPPRRRDRHDYLRRLRRRPRRRSSTWTRSAPPRCTSASIRSAARASPTGTRSASATASTSRS